MGQGPQDTLRSAFVRPTFRDFVGPTQPASAPPLARWQQVLGDALVSGTDVFGELSGLYPLLDLIGVPTPQSQSRQAGELLAAAVPVLGATKALRVANPIKAYHGSPHDFDQFSLSKIGTGEGAQAYGHGLYFAENPAVAKDYRDRLTDATAPVTEVMFRGQRVTPGTPEEHAAKLLGDSGADKRELMSWARRTAKEASTGTDLGMEDIGKKAGMTGAEYYKRLHDFMANASKRDVKISRGRTYEVNIHADPDQFLDWDKPLINQPSVLAAFKKRGMAGKIDGEWHLFTPEGAIPLKTDISAGDAYSFGQDANGLVLGSDAYRQMTSRFGDISGRKNPLAAASASLKKAGVPGIKYYDGMSRGAKEGTRNYVIFDDRLVEIVKKYGIAGAVSAGLLNEMQARQFRDAGYQ